MSGIAIMAAIILTGTPCDACSVAFLEDTVIAGSAAVGVAELPSSIPMSVFAVTMDGDEMVALHKVAGPIDAADGVVSIPVPAETVGSPIVFGPDDLTVDGEFIPSELGGTEVSMGYVLSDYALDEGLDSTTTFFTSNVAWGNDGDVYNVEMLIDGAWVPVGETGADSGIDYDDLRTISGPRHSASIIWEVPQVEPGKYPVRVFNETDELPSATEHSVTIPATTEVKAAKPQLPPDAGN